MATTVYYCAASLDGYIAGADDSLDWLTGYQGSFEGEGAEPGPMSEGGAYERFYERVEALVMGSATYEWILDHLDLAGGGGVASQFADEGRLDEVHLTVVPTVLGAGKPLFERPLPSGSMQLTGTSTFRNGMVELRYAASR